MNRRYTVAALDAAQRDRVVRVLGLCMHLAGLVPGAWGHRGWNWFVELQARRFEAVVDQQTRGGVA